MKAREFFVRHGDSEGNFISSVVKIEVKVANVESCPIPNRLLAVDQVPKVTTA